MILALELCEEIVVYGMVSDSYCRLVQPGPGQEGSWGGLGDRGPHADGSRSCGVQAMWASGWVAEAQTALGPGAHGKAAQPLGQARTQYPLCQCSLRLGMPPARAAVSSCMKEVK